MYFFKKLEHEPLYRGLERLWSLEWANIPAAFLETFRHAWSVVSTCLGSPLHKRKRFVPPKCPLQALSFGYRHELSQYADVCKTPCKTSEGFCDKLLILENRRVLQDRGILSRIFETAATARKFVIKSPCPEEAFCFQLFYSGCLSTRSYC